MRAHPRHVILFALVAFCSPLLRCSAAHGVEDDVRTQTGRKRDDDDEHRKKGSSSPKKVISLAESIRKSQIAMRKERALSMQTYWKDTFEEIRNLAVFPPTSTNGRPKNPFDAWKLVLMEEEQEEQLLQEEQQVSQHVQTKDSEKNGANGSVHIKEQQPQQQAPQRRKRARFEGFASWDRMLQEWADDAADYLERNQVEEQEYPFSTFGIPTKVLRNLTVDTPQSDELEETNGAMHEVREVEPVATDFMVSLNGTVNLVPPVELPKPRAARKGEAIVPHTDISDKSKRLWIVTTAALPWMTGTAVNALLRAAYLCKGRKGAGGKVTLMLPWLDKDDQSRVYGKDNVFETQADQEEHIRTWLRETANLKQPSEDLNIAWYTGRQERAENSIYSMGDITALIPEEEVDICILEEPEHLNWYRAPGAAWTEKFKHVVGIIHTNYFVYAQEQPGALVRAPAMKLLCSWMCRAHCHRVIKLSGTLGKFAPEKELVENVHGVRATFLDIGEDVRKKLSTARERETNPVFGSNADPSIYFIGKMLWSKGLGSLMELLKYAEESANLKLKVDMYGGGPDKDAAESKCLDLGLDMPFHGPVDHSKLAMSHKIFINPSTSEVLCTTVAEALAMGKFVILPSHPSNDFFAQFPNCLPYASKEEFVGNLYYAITHAPEPLTEEYSHALSWEAATERLEATGSISVAEAEATAQAMAASDASVEFNLPPIIKQESRRKKLATGLQKSRERYRQFRSRLAADIKENKVLPKYLQRILIAELDKRLDVDIDAVLESPKLRLQLSPAELDKRLLEFYKGVTSGASGDLVRVIGGGTNVGRQNMYLKQQARKRSQSERKLTYYIDPVSSLPVWPDDSYVAESDRTAAEWVRLALRRNLPNRDGRPSNGALIPRGTESAKHHAGDDELQMSCFPSSRTTYRTSQPRIPISSRSVMGSSFSPIQRMKSPRL
uniref:Digalactosyldiacylglycerol synthase n=1 Tax=Grammatophora oceanica TaxID=210454 RepID=A0A7S1YBU4_9STRA|mmetsp:Transcript_38073/g.56661  ORF Transcript_38073/g.56661 Transcript_38073/m.56661 type:complete len:952 (+) Transcript_38073:166-3021(+)